MAIFDQRDQQVTYQYNAAGDINFGAVRDRATLVGELEKLRRSGYRPVRAGARTGLTGDRTGWPARGWLLGPPRGTHPVPVEAVPPGQ